MMRFVFFKNHTGCSEKTEPTVKECGRLFRCMLTVAEVRAGRLVCSHRREQSWKCWHQV